MTSDELRKLADDDDGVRWYGGGACINDALREAADEIDRLTAWISDVPRNDTLMPPEFQRLWESCVSLLEKADFKFFFRRMEKLEQENATLTQRVAELTAEQSQLRELVSNVAAYKFENPEGKTILDFMRLWLEQSEDARKALESSAREIIAELAEAVKLLKLCQLSDIGLPLCMEIDSFLKRTEGR